MSLTLYQLLKGKSNEQIHDTQSSLWHSVRDPVLPGITQMVELDNRFSESNNFIGGNQNGRKRSDNRDPYKE